MATNSGESPVAQSHNFENEISRELKELPRLTPDHYCIYRIPENLRHVNPEAYTPCRVAIGPFHAANNRLKDMEEYKLMCLRALKSRSSGGVEIKEYIAAIAELESKARGCYLYSSGKEDAEDFKMMLLIDGAFILEFFCRVLEATSTAGPIDAALTRMRNFVRWGVDVVDPISANCTRKVEICRDLILMENQIPFFVLERLYELTFVNRTGGITLGEIAYHCLKYLIPIKNSEISFEEVRNRTGSGQQVMHLVHFIRLCCPSFSDNIIGGPSSSKKYLEWKFCFMRLSFHCCEVEEDDDLRSVSVTDLHEAGVQFKLVENEDDRGLLKITFDNGVVKMPSLRLDDDTETFFRNVIAFEQYYYLDSQSQITNYMGFMDRLIETKDVHILEKSKVLENLLESKADVTKIFNGISKHTVCDFDDYKDVSDNMVAYAGRRWNKWKTMLRRNYFGTPWALISFLAAFVLLGLTLVQTIASIRSANW